MGLWALHRLWLIRAAAAGAPGWTPGFFTFSFEKGRGCQGLKEAPHFDAVLLKGLFRGINKQAYEETGHSSWICETDREDS